MAIDEPSPKQRDKRRQIIEAARVVLARDGLAGCTARAVADASPLTKSAIHYYFEDIDEIIDRAMAAHVDAMVVSLREVAGRHPDPGERLWAVLWAYLATFADRPHAAYLWFEYWVAAGRRGSTAAAEEQLDKMRALLAELLTGLVADREAVARALLSWLLGSIVQQQVRPRAEAELRAEATRLLASAG